MRLVAAAAAALALAMLVRRARARRHLRGARVRQHRGRGAERVRRRSADSMMSAYSICPPSSGVGTGIVTKATSNGGRAPYLARGVPGVHARRRAPSSPTSPSTPARSASTSDWSAGIVAFDGDWDAGDYPVRLLPVDLLLRHRELRSSRSRRRSTCSRTRASGSRRAASTRRLRPVREPVHRRRTAALFSAANVTVRVRDVAPPALAPPRRAVERRLASRSRGGLDAPTRTARGSCSSRLYVDGVVRQTHGLPRRRRCRTGRVATSRARDRASTSSPAGPTSTRRLSPTGPPHRRGGDRRRRQPRAGRPDDPGRQLDPGQAGGRRGRRRRGLATRQPLRPALVEPAGPGGADHARPLPAVPGRRRRLRRGRRGRAAASPRSGCASPSRGSGLRASGWRTRPATTTPAARATPCGCASTTRRRPHMFEEQDPRDPRTVRVRVADAGSGAARRHGRAAAHRHRRVDRRGRPPRRRRIWRRASTTSSSRTAPTSCARG